MKPRPAAAKRPAVKRAAAAKRVPAKRVASKGDQRIHIRFDKIFPVIIGSEIFGDTAAIARNISAGGMLVEMGEPLPLGSLVTVHFAHTNGDGQRIVARAEVKHHYCLNFSQGDQMVATRAVGLRFIEFDRAVDRAVASRILH